LKLSLFAIDFQLVFFCLFRGGNMPDVNEYDNQDDFMAVCVPTMKQEGKSDDEASAACLEMWQNREGNSGEATGEEAEGAKSAPLPGNALKTIGKTPEELRVANYMVLFGGRDLTGYAWGKNPDGTLGEYFSDRTEFESNYTKTGQLYVDFEHALDPDGLGIGEDEILGYVDWKTATRDERGLFVERVLNRRQKYVQWLEELIDAGLIGNSTETIRGKAVRSNDGEILAWPLKRDTLTVQPMEPRMLTGNQLQAVKALAEVWPDLKSLVTSDVSSIAETRDGKVKHGDNPKEKSDMEGKDELKAVLDGFKSELITEIRAEVEKAVEPAAEKAVEKALDNLPEAKARMNGTVQVTEDPGDRPFKSIAEQMRAVKAYRFVGFENADARLKKQITVEAKAIQGANELIPSQGQFLLDPTLVADFLKPVHEEGPFSSRARRMPVSGNSNYGWINGIDETARTAGNRWGGVRGYWLAEGDALTKSQPKFRRINWELHKVGVLMYATDELLADAAQLNAVLQQSAVEELNFMVNDAIVRGTGAGQPSGILNSGALISATRTNATNIDHDDVMRMINRLQPELYASAVWFAHPDTQPEIDALSFTSGSTGILSPYVTYTDSGVTMLRGRPVVYNEFCPSLGSVGDLLLAGMDDYLTWEKGGVEAASSVHVEFLTDQQVFRFIYRTDGKPASYTALTPYQGSTTRSPYVALAATT
jgi:HK97 family phage major capsid protein